MVAEGRLTDVDVWLAGEFTEMEEFVVQDILQLGAGSETALLALRFESPALMDSIGSDLMSKAGASDAAAALRLVSGASLQDGKSAVVRGLPDGLNEKAIEAVYQLAFTPARNAAGQPVDSWVTVTVSFTIR